MSIDIGKIYRSIFPFYDVVNKKYSFKRRPVLVIGKPDIGDCNVLPISGITKQQNINPDYDIPLVLAKYQLLGLSKDSYIRTHKQMIINTMDVVRECGDLKKDYPDTYLLVLEKLEQYNKRIIDLAL